MPRDRSARTAALQAGWLASQLPAARRFRRARRHPEAALATRLRALLATLGSSAHGRALGLDRSGAPDAFRRHVPVGDYPSHAPFIDRVAAGEPNVLTTEPIEVFERTGGTGGATKLIPYTARLRAEFAEAVGAWMVDLHRHHRGLLGTRSYWSVSRAVRERETTPGGIPIGFDDDAAYFGPVTRWALGRLLAVPSSVARSPTLEDWRRQTAIHLAECADLGLISVWSPSFLTVLLDWMYAHREELSDSLTTAARDRLARATTGDRLDGSVLWPRLGLVSAWGDGFAASLLPEMTASFPGIPVQPKGLLATEGVVSFPRVGTEGGVVAVTSHLLELRDLDDGRVVWAHEARPGPRYQPLLTTGGGLVRYALPDAVEVVGFAGRLPCVRLVGRTDKASDLVGEKLTEAFVDSVFRGLWARRSGFAMLLPRAEPRGYVLVVDRDPPAPEAVDQALRAAYHYGYARDLGQLAPVEMRVLSDAWARWERAIEASGLVLGEQKPGALEVRGVVAERVLDGRAA